MDRVLPVIKKHIRLVIIVAVFIFLGIGLIFFLKPVTNTLTYTVKRENLLNTVLVNGTYTTASQTQVMSPTDGIITKLYVDNNSEVNKGAPLFHVESTATQDQQKAAYAAYLAASSTVQADTAALYTLQSEMYSAWKKYTDLSTNSTYQNSDGSPNTTNRVLPEFTTSQDDWLAGEANYKNQQAVLAKDNAALSSAQLSYNETKSVTVDAPARGKIINLSVKINDQVSAPIVPTSGSESVVTPVLIITDFSNPVMTSPVDQVNIPKIHIGQKASVVFDALPDTTFSGTVQTIDTAGTKTQGTVIYNVGVVLSDVSSQVRPNMTGSITIETSRENNVLTVPNDAIIKKDGKTFVQLSGGSNSLREVMLGLKGLIKTGVKSGLAEGDIVIEQQ